MHNDHHQDYDHMAYNDLYEQAPQQQKPLDPAVERIRRKLMRLMIISVGITILLIVAVLVGIIYKVMSTPAPTQQAAAQPSQIVSQLSNTSAELQNNVPQIPTKPELLNRLVDLPLGTRILSQSLSGNLISLETLTPEGKSELVIYDYKQDNLIAKITLATEETQIDTTNKADSQ